MSAGIAVMRGIAARRWLVLGLTLGPVPAFAQTVTLADLEGATVEARITVDQRVRKDGREFPVQNTQRIRVVFRTGSIIDWSIVPVAVSVRGTRQGATRTGSAELGKPRNSKYLGGGEGLWLFEGGTLTTLRTYKDAGGHKRNIAFERKGGEIVCTAKEGFMREEGARRISLNSGIDGAPVTVLSHKFVGSNCKVALKKPGA